MIAYLKPVDNKIGPQVHSDLYKVELKCGGLQWVYIKFPDFLI